MKLTFDNATRPLSKEAKSATSSAGDIKDLFLQFGAEPGRYQEILTDKRIHDSELNWPLLSRLSISYALTPPQVRMNEAPAAFQSSAFPDVQLAKPAALNPRAIYAQDEAMTANLLQHSDTVKSPQSVTTNVLSTLIERLAKVPTPSIADILPPNKVLRTS